MAVFRIERTRDYKQKLMRIFCHESIPIFWDDLTWQKQMELREALGGNGNYDIFPLAEVPVPFKEEESE